MVGHDLDRVIFVNNINPEEEEGNEIILNNSVMAQKILEVVHRFPDEPIYLKDSLMRKQERLQDLAMVLDAEGSTPEDNFEIRGNLHISYLL